MKNDTVLLTERQKVKLWAQIVPFAVVVVSILFLKVLAVAVLVMYLVGMLAFYRLIGKWESPVVERLLHLLKMLGIGLGFVFVAVFIHAVIYMTA
jgi:hypothetical protein